MNIKDLKYFVAVAELGHFGKAAEKCYVSQPTLSGQLKKLEQSLGVALFERNNRTVLLTPVGQAILSYAKQVLTAIDTIQEVAHASIDPWKGKFKLGAFPTLSTYIFPKMVPIFCQQLPDMRLILLEEKTENLIKQLKCGELDAALLALPIDDNTFVTEALFEDIFYLAVPMGHPLTQYEKITQQQLQAYALLLLEEGHCLRDQSLAICHRYDINETQDFRATGLETLRQMVKAGTGITFMPKIAIQPEENNICYIPFYSPEPKRTIGLVWRKTSIKQQVITRLIDIIQAGYDNNELKI